MKRYLPQIRLENIGKDGQERLLKSTVLVVGCGALGSPVSMYLAAAGVGNIIIADFDTIDISNLHRQVFFNENEVGLSKAECLKNRMNLLNSEVRVTTLTKLVTNKVLESLTEKLDLIVDAADNPATTYMLDDFCARKGTPLSTAGVSEWNAQVFFYYPGAARYSDVFPKPQDTSGVLPCSIAGITGPVAAFAASLQSADVIKFLSKADSIRDSRLTCANLLENKVEVML